MANALAAAEIGAALMGWYDANARVLPWRIAPADLARGIRPDPYRVWLSEVMLQQTTVAAVTRLFQPIHCALADGRGPGRRAGR